MKITCRRQLSDIETEDLMYEARIMQACGEVKGWAGFGMLSQTRTPDTWHFVDQKYKEYEGDNAAEYAKREGVFYTYTHELGEIE